MIDKSSISIKTRTAEKNEKYPKYGCITITESPKQIKQLHFNSEATRLLEVEKASNGGATPVRIAMLRAYEGVEELVVGLTQLDRIPTTEYDAAYPTAQLGLTSGKITSKKYIEMLSEEFGEDAVTVGSEFFFCEDQGDNVFTLTNSIEEAYVDTVLDVEADDVELEQEENQEPKYVTDGVDLDTGEEREISLEQA